MIEDIRLFTLIEEDLKSKLTNTTEIRVILSIFEQLKWKLRNYRDGKEFVEITFYDPGEVEIDGVKVWKTVGTRKVTIKSPFCNDDNLDIFINDAVAMIRFIFNEAVRFKRMYSHYEIHGVTYNPWLSPDDKFVKEGVYDTVMVYDKYLVHSDISDIIEDRSNLDIVFYKEKGKYHIVYDVVLKEEYIKEKVDTLNCGTVEVNIPYNKIYLFISREPEDENTYDVAE